MQAGILVVERQFGYLEMHGSTDAVQAAASAVLTALGVTAAAATAPQVLASRIITRVDNQHAFLVNRNKLGSMVLPGRIAVRLRAAAGVVRDPGRQRGREGRADQDRRLPHDRRDRPGVPVRPRGRRAAGRRDSHEPAGRATMSRRRAGDARPPDELRALIREVLRDLLPARSAAAEAPPAPVVPTSPAASARQPVPPPPAARRAAGVRASRRARASPAHPLTRRPASGPRRSAAGPARGDRPGQQPRRQQQRGGQRRRSDGAAAGAAGDRRGPAPVRAARSCGWPTTRRAAGTCSPGA